MRTGQSLHTGRPRRSPLHRCPATAATWVATAYTDEVSLSEHRAHVELIFGIATTLQTSQQAYRVRPGWLEKASLHITICNPSTLFNTKVQRQYSIHQDTTDKASTAL